MVLKYFDLNRRYQSACAGDDCGNENISGNGPDIGPGDDSHGAKGQDPPPAEAKGLSALKQLTMYAGIFIGVLFSSCVEELSGGNAVSPGFSASVIIVSTVVALVIIPVVYEKLKIDLSAPFIVQLGIFVQSGVFWHVIFTSIGKLI